MPRFANTTRLVVGTLSFAAGLTAQSTAATWSTYFGGSSRDEITALHRDPNGVITVVGFSDSTDLATTVGSLNPTPLQPAAGGSYDAFVARFDPALPPASQLLWCTYVGGSGDDFAFDLTVDPLTSVITVVGVSASSDFPGAMGQAGPTLQGQSDGFLIQIDPTGAALLTSMLVGGSGADHLSTVVPDGSNSVTVCGGTTSSDLPWTAGTVWPVAPGGGSDAFVARIAPGNPAGTQGIWATYLGGSGSDGITYADYAAANGWPFVWEGRLANHGLALDPAGNAVVVIESELAVLNPVTTPNAVQSSPAGGLDLYLAVIDPTGTSLQYATFFGGSGADSPTCIEAHPGGGFVIGGYTTSTDLPVTAGCVASGFQTCGANCWGPDIDGLVCHIDPALGAGGLRYASYLPGDAGEDGVADLAVESSGIVTLAGYCAGAGNYPITPRALQPGAGTQYFFGAVTRIAMRGQGTDDVLYSTRIGGTNGANFVEGWVNTIALDELGNVITAGTCTDALPIVQAHQGVVAGGIYDGSLTAFPLLPGCTGRSDVALATPACGVPLYFTLGGAPEAGGRFELHATNAPPLSVGAVALKTTNAPITLPEPMTGTLLVAPLATVTLVSDGLGTASFPILVPSTLSTTCPVGYSAQWLWLANATCPGIGPIATSERLDF